MWFIVVFIQEICVFLPFIFNSVMIPWHSKSLACDSLIMELDICNWKVIGLLSSVLIQDTSVSTVTILAKRQNIIPKFLAFFYLYICSINLASMNHEGTSGMVFITSKMGSNLPFITDSIAQLFTFIFKVFYTEISSRPSHHCVRLSVLCKAPMKWASRRIQGRGFIKPLYLR